MSLFDLLACPVCKHPVVRQGRDELRCTRCGRTYPIVDGVPVMLEDPSTALVEHEAELGVRDGYSPWKDRVLVSSLTDAQVVLDFGAGRQALDDPCIIRMDLALNRWVDVVGDLQALPFLPGSLDLAFGGAVMEHLSDPWRAIDELWAVLKPGGYIYADWNFIIAYHGYPHHYFNASKHGMREAFKRFSILDEGVAPFHGASFALTSFIATYLRHFRPQTRVEHDFALHLTKVLWYPIEDYDRRIAPEDRFRVAASGYLFGVKQPTGVEHLIPAPIMRAYEQSPELQQRFPRPLDLASPDNLMRWAKGDGVGRDAPIRDYFAALTPFSKYTDGRPFARPIVRGWAPDVVDVVHAADAAPRAARLWESHSLWLRLREGRAREGAMGMVRACLLTARQGRHALRHLLAVLLARVRGR